MYNFSVSTTNSKSLLETTENGSEIIRHLQNGRPLSLLVYTKHTTAVAVSSSCASRKQLQLFSTASFYRQYLMH